MNIQVKRLWHDFFLLLLFSRPPLKPEPQSVFKVMYELKNNTVAILSPPLQNIMTFLHLENCCFTDKCYKREKGMCLLEDYCSVSTFCKNCHMLNTKKVLTLEVPIVTNINFLSMISVHCQEIRL